jgi:excisionase family DNA binding protein
MFENRIALSVREAATACGYSPEAVRRAIQDKKLVAERPGGRGDYRILVEDLREWLRGAGQERVDRPAPNRTTSVA